MSPPPANLREAHAHIPAHGREMSCPWLGDARDAGDCLDRLARRASRIDTDREPGWLIGTGLRIEGWREPRWPTIDELDRACPRRPCMVHSFDHHSGVVNRAALAAAGLDSSAHPSASLVQRDARGEPTGLLLEGAFDAARAAIPEPTPEQWRSFVRASLDDLARHGFVEVHDLLSPPWLGPILRDMERAGELATTVWLYPALDLLENVAAGGSPAWESPRIRLAGGKVFADGTLNARTAWMLEPYADPIPGSPHGHAMMTVAQLREAIARTRAHGLGLAVHAIGDGAVRATLEAWEQEGTEARAHEGTKSREWARAANGLPALRIEHCEVIDARDVPRFAALGVVCSVQPCHLLYDIEALRRGQPRRLDRVLPLRDLIASGCRPGELLWFGSDTPIVRPNPEDSVRAAVERRRGPGSTGGGESSTIAPDQAIREADCWRAFALTTS